MKISIIMPVYNGEKHIERAVLSVINQDFKFYELIIVDGKSTDKTIKIIQKYKKHIKKIISEPDNGYSDALNKGIKESSGDYVFMLASDDYLIPNALANFSKTVSPNTDVWCGSVIHRKKYGYLLIPSDTNLEKLREHSSIRHAASIFKKTVFINYGLYNTNYVCASDREFLLRLFIKGAIFQFQSFPVVLFYMGGLSSLDPKKYAYPEDEKISISYGMPIEKAKTIYKNRVKKLRKIIFREKFKIIFARIGLLNTINKVFNKGSNLLTKKDLRKLGVPETLID